MSEISTCSPRAAAKLISPGSIKKVRVLFQTRGGQVALVQAPKVHVKRMLRALPDDAMISIEIMRGFAEATLAGVVGPVRAGDISEAASVARRLS